MIFTMVIIVTVVNYLFIVGFRVTQSIFCTVHVLATKIDWHLYVEARWLCLAVHYAPCAKQSMH